mmetsp:Transcript_24648/g.65750  ORF Transcript_24648/g.65750 Transcript_24648/m.65750 type:complete len:364 (-) Transcript_24648:1529-2620(-)
MHTNSSFFIGPPEQCDNDAESLGQLLVRERRRADGEPQTSALLPRRKPEIKREGRNCLRPSTRNRPTGDRRYTRSTGSAVRSPAASGPEVGPPRANPTEHEPCRIHWEKKTRRRIMMRPPAVLNPASPRSHDLARERILGREAGGSVACGGLLRHKAHQGLGPRVVGARLPRRPRAVEDPGPALARHPALTVLALGLEDDDLVRIVLDYGTGAGEGGRDGGRGFDLRIANGSLHQELQIIVRHFLLALRAADVRLQDRCALGRESCLVSLHEAARLFCKLTEIFWNRVARPSITERLSVSRVLMPRLFLELSFAAFSCWKPRLVNLHAFLTRSNSTMMARGQDGAGGGGRAMNFHRCLCVCVP